MDKFFEQIEAITDRFPGVGKLIAPAIVFIFGFLINILNKRESSTKEAVENHRREMKEDQERFRREYEEKEKKLNEEISRVMLAIDRHVEDIRANRIEFSQWWATLLEFRDELRRISEKLGIEKNVKRKKKSS